MQKRAEEALRRGDFQAAREAQQNAMSALQDRSSELARLNDENDPNAREERDDRDILDEIRRRAGNRALTKEDLEYLQRLLERF